MIRRSRQEQTDNTPSARAAADACGHLYQELSRWVGPEGCHALFARAIAEVRDDHPALKHLELRPRSDPYVHGVDEGVLEHGDAAIEAALESVLAVLFDLLFRLIGNDMAMKLIKRSLTPPDNADGHTDRKREEA